jgi:hypothetical protein
MSDNQFQLSSDSFHIAAKSREVHIDLSLDLGYGGLFDFQSRSYLGLGLAGKLSKFAEVSDQASKTGLVSLLPMGLRNSCDLGLVMAHIS